MTWRSTTCSSPVHGGPRRGIACTAFDAVEVRAAAHGTGTPDGRPRHFPPLRRAHCSLGTQCTSKFEGTGISGPPLAEWAAHHPFRATRSKCRATAFVPEPFEPFLRAGPFTRVQWGRPRTFETFVLRITCSRDAAWRGADDEVSMTIDPAALPAPPPFAGALVASAGPDGAHRPVRSGARIRRCRAGAGRVRP